jgi:hypothetical protein
MKKIFDALQEDMHRRVVFEERMVECVGQALEELRDIRQGLKDILGGK